jgi:hypothetical protein
MSNFWNTSDGQSAQGAEGSFAIVNDRIPPIPKGTSVLATAEEAKVSEYQGVEYINIKWRVAKPAEYANRVIYQKVHVYANDAQKADKAKRMLAAIAANAGGGLFTEMAKRNESRPSDISLSQLCNRPMVLKLDTWCIDKDDRGQALPADQVKDGNWVQAVSPAKGSAAATVAAQPAPVAKPKPAPAPVDSFDDDIPFADPYRGARSLLV